MAGGPSVPPLIVLVVAWQVRWGGLSAVSLTLATVAYGALAPWHPLEVPWTFVPVVAAMVVLAEVLWTFWPPTAGTRGRPPDTDPADAAPGDAPPSHALPGPPSTRPTPHVRRTDHPVVADPLGRRPPRRGPCRRDGRCARIAGVNGWIPATWCATGAVAIALDARRRTGAWASGERSSYSSAPAQQGGHG